MFVNSDHKAGPSVDHTVFHQIGLIGGYLNGHIRGFDLKALCIHYI